MAAVHRLIGIVHRDAAHLLSEIDQSPMGLLLAKQAAHEQSAAPGEEGREHGAASVGEHTTCRRDLVVETRIATQIVERAAGTGLGVDGAEDEPSESRGHGRTGTHGTRFQGDDHRRFVESPPREGRRRVLQCEHLRMCGRIFSRLSFVVTGGDHDPVHHHDGSHRDLAVRGCDLCLLERDPHRRLVVGDAVRTLLEPAQGSPYLRRASDISCGGGGI